MPTFDASAEGRAVSSPSAARMRSFRSRGAHGQCLLAPNLLGRRPSGAMRRTNPPPDLIGRGSVSWKSRMIRESQTKVAIAYWTVTTG